VGGLCLDERLRVWLNAEEGAIKKRAASKVIEMRFKVFVSSSAVSFRGLAGIVPKTDAAVRMTPKDRDLVASVV
jgi:hypothetical protein